MNDCVGVEKRFRMKSSKNKQTNSITTFLWKTTTTSTTRRSTTTTTTIVVFKKVFIVKNLKTFNSIYLCFVVWRLKIILKFPQDPFAI